MEVKGLGPDIICESALRITKASANRNANRVRNTVTGLKAQTNNLESVGMIGKRNRSQMTEEEYIELLKVATDEYVRLDELSYL